MFIGDFEKSATWNTSAIKGCKRFLDRIWNLHGYCCGGRCLQPRNWRSSFHKTVKKVSEDIEAMKFNTAIAAMMSLLNEIYDAGSITHEELRTLLKLAESLRAPCH